MGVLMWHPETGGIFVADNDDAVAHYRASGWLRADEREEHEKRIAAHPSQKKAAKAASKDEGN